MCPNYSSDKDFGFFFIAQCSVGKSYESGDKLYWTLNFYHPNNTAKYNLKFYNMDVYDSHELSDIVKNACKSGDYIFTLSPLETVTQKSVYDVEYITNMKDTGQKVLNLSSMTYQEARFPGGRTSYNTVAPCSLEIGGSYNSYTYSTFKYLWNRNTAWVSLFASYPTLQDFKNLPQDLPYFPQHNSSCASSAMFKSNYKTPDNYVKYRDSIGCGKTLASSNLTSDYLDKNDQDFYIRNYDYWEDDDD